MSGEIPAGIVVIGNLSAGTTAAGTFTSASDAAATVINVGQTAQSIVSIATSSISVTGMGAAFNASQISGAIKNIWGALSNQTPVAQSDVAQLVGNIFGLAANCIILADGSDWVVVPLVLVSTAAGGWQLVATANAWTVSASGSVAQTTLTSSQLTQAALTTQTLSGNQSVLDSALQSVGLSTSDASGQTFLVPKVDSSGNLTTSTDESPTSTTTLANGATRYTFPDGTTLTVDAAGGDANNISVNAFDRVWSIPISGGGTATLDVNSGNGSYQFSATDANGNVLINLSLSNSTSTSNGITTTTSDVSSSIGSYTAASGNTYTYNLDGSSSLSVTNTAGQQTALYTFDANGALTGSSQFTYTGNGQLSTVQTFDANGDETSLTDMTYNADGQLTGETLFNGDNQKVSALTFDPDTGDVTQENNYIVGTKQLSSTISYSDGVISVETDYANGQPDDKLYFDANGDLTTEQIFNSNLQQTDYVLFDAATGEMTQDRKFDPATGKQTITYVYQDGQEVGYADYVNGQQSDYITIDPTTGLVTQDVERNPQTGNETAVICYDDNPADGNQITGEALFNDQGRQTDYLVFDPTTGQMSADEVRDPDTGQWLEIDYYDTDGQIDGVRLYNSNTEMTDYEVIDPGTGEVTQDRQFDPTTGEQTATIIYQDGQEVGYAGYVDGQQTSYETIDPATGQVTESDVMDPTTGVWTEMDFYQNGLLTETKQYDAVTGAETAQLNYQDGDLVSQALFNDNGQQDGWQTFDPVTGQVTENEVRDPTTGVWTELDFYQNGLLTETKQYDAVTGTETAQLNYQDGDLVSQALFNDNGQQDGWQNFDPVTGQVTENEVRDPTTGVWTELDFYQNGVLTETKQYDAVTGTETAQLNYQDGDLVSQALFNANGQQDGWQNFDPATGQVTENEVRDPTTGVWTETDFYQNGQLTETVLYDPETGVETAAYLYQDGTLQNEATFADVDGQAQQDGYYWFNDQQQVTAQSIFGDGQQTGYQSIDPATGQVTENEVRDPTTGVWTELDFYQNGQLTQTQQYDAVTGVETAALSYQGGVLQTEATFTDVNGQAQQDGYFWFNDQQQVTAQAIFSDGQQVDTIFYDTSSGVVTGITTISGGAVTGEVFFNDDPNNHYVNRVDVIDNGQVTDYVNINSQGQATSGTPDAILNPWVFTQVGDAVSANVNGLLASGFDYSVLDLGSFTDSLAGLDDSLYGLNDLADLGSELDTIGDDIDSLSEYAGLAGSQSVINQTLGAGLDAAAQAVGGGTAAGTTAAEGGLQEAALAAQLSSMSGGTGTSIFEGASWNSNVVTWSFGDSTSGFSADMTSTEEILVEQAFATWAAASGLQFVEVADPSQADITLGLADLDTASTGVVGMTTTPAQDGVFASGATIRIEDPNQDALTTDADGQLAYSGTDAEFEQVVLHEIGHALGLASNADVNSIMYYELGATNRTLDATDLAGIQTLYGGNASATSSSAVSQLIQAMAAYAPQSSAGTTVTGTIEQPQTLLAAA
ncbi:matrixin family metalloprotease [Paraburkholderia adhaesiva]|uniref:matrixin family metalloprotease n=1 Tax=Paraburkholderia adhaesiva TaxID=2883244 RepID=UPI001F407188|nr:matrixin family metalloprotease [Paraburkholderia adhaesiva]